MLSPKRAGTAVAVTLVLMAKLGSRLAWQTIHLLTTSRAIVEAFDLGGNMYRWRT